MIGQLVQLTLGRENPEGVQSFNNDFPGDPLRDAFDQSIEDVLERRRIRSHTRRRAVPRKMLHENVHHHWSRDIFMLEDAIYVGEYCDHGVIAPRNQGPIVFDYLFNCTPLVSLIRGDEDYISFLHTWAIHGDYKVVDKQVEHWMKLIANQGEVLETVFAPRTGGRGANTTYTHALDLIKAVSRETIVLDRDVTKIIGVADTTGVFFRDCGYHLWKN